MRDGIDTQLLNLLQREFPVAAHPYRVLGDKLGISEEETFQRVKNLKESGYIRRFGGVFDSGKLGYVSILCAAKVTQEALETVASTISQCPEVTHNYVRSHDYNLWFTITAESVERRSQLVESLKTLPGIIDFMALPAVSKYKIQAVFNVQEVSADA